MVVPGVTTNYAESDGSVGDRLSDYLEARARGGFGVIITENIGVHATGRVMPRMVMGHEDRYLPGLARLADVSSAKAPSRSPRSVMPAGRPRAR